MNGRATNLISSDLEKVWGIIENNADLYKGPVETLVFSVFIYRSMGLSGLTGVFVILCFIPFQTWFSDITSKYRENSSKVTDQRLQFVSEVINVIQLIKMYGWESSFAKMMEKIRSKEMKWIEKSWFIYALLMVLKVVAKVSMFLSLAAYVLAGNVLTSDKVFMLSIYYYYLNISMVQYWSLALKATYEGFVSIKRLEEFLLENNETQVAIVKKTSLEKGSIEMRQATASWTTDIATKSIGIDSVSQQIRPGSLNLVVGQVASGKSSLLHAIIGELELDEGKIEVSGEISYASQKPWLFNDTIRNNILFGEAYDDERYKKVVEVCALNRDFYTFLQGDETVVAERGTSLSGGQKARINLARAVYKTADVYVFDDVLSAVDATVGNKIFFECFKKFLKEKTIILVTHQLQYLNESDNFVVMNNGQIQSQGAGKDAKNVNFKRILSQTEKEESSKFDDKTEPKEDEIELPEQVDEEQKSLTENLKEYLKATGNVKFIIFVSIVTISTQVANIGIDKFLVKWTDWEEALSSESEDLTLIRNQFLRIYLALIVLLTLFSYKAYVLMFSSFIKASHKLHNQMFASITRTSMDFFFKNSSGKIISRFSGDIGRLDEEAPNVLFCVFTVKTLQNSSVLLF